MNMSKPRRPVRPALLIPAALALPLAGCITVEPPDKPIEINLNIDIRQEVLVRLQEDVEQIIRETPEAFPQSQTPGSPR